MGTVQHKHEYQREAKHLRRIENIEQEGPVANNDVAAVVAAGTGAGDAQEFLFNLAPSFVISQICSFLDTRQDWNNFLMAKKALYQLARKDMATISLSSNGGTNYDLYRRLSWPRKINRKEIPQSYKDGSRRAISPGGDFVALACPWGDDTKIPIVYIVSRVHGLIASIVSSNHSEISKSYYIGCNLRFVKERNDADISSVTSSCLHLQTIDDSGNYQEWKILPLVFGEGYTASLHNEWTNPELEEENRHLEFAMDGELLTVIMLPWPKYWPYIIMVRIHDGGVALRIDEAKYTNNICLSPDGSLLAITGRRDWDPSASTFLQVLELETTNKLADEANVLGTIEMTGRRASYISNEALATEHIPHLQRHHYPLSFSPNGQELATWNFRHCGDGVITVLDIGKLWDTKCEETGMYLLSDCSLHRFHNLRCKNSEIHKTREDSILVLGTLLYSASGKQLIMSLDGHGNRIAKVGGNSDDGSDDDSDSESDIESDDGSYWEKSPAKNLVEVWDIAQDSVVSKMEGFTCGVYDQNALSGHTTLILGDLHSRPLFEIHIMEMNSSGRRVN